MSGLWLASLKNESGLCGRNSLLMLKVYEKGVYCAKLQEHIDFSPRDRLDLTHRVLDPLAVWQALFSALGFNRQPSLAGVAAVHDLLEAQVAIGLPGRIG